MEFDTKAFFTENEEDSVSGFVIVETSETGPGYGEPSYRVVEKWDRESDEAVWVTYWIPAATLRSRVQRDEAAYVKQVSDDQFRGVMNLAGVAESVENARKQTA